jgi:hypothetical protein
VNVSLGDGNLRIAHDARQSEYVTLRSHASTESVSQNRRVLSNEGQSIRERKQIVPCRPKRPRASVAFRNSAEASDRMATASSRHSRQSTDSGLPVASARRACGFSRCRLARARVDALNVSAPTKTTTMTPWKRLVLISAAAGAGFAVTASLIVGGFLWYESRPKPTEPWNTGAIKATFESGSDLSAGLEPNRPPAHRI